MSTDTLKLIGFGLAGVLAVAAVFVPQAAPVLQVLVGGVVGWLGLRRPGDGVSK